jgi:hypothetical protein
MGIITDRYSTKQDRLALVVRWLIRILLLASALWEIKVGRMHILYLNLFVLVLTFLPVAIKFVFKVSFPVGFEILFYISLLVMVGAEKFLEGTFIQVFLGVLVGIIGFVLIYVLYYNKQERANAFLVALFAFCFAASLGAVWEVFQYVMIEQLKMGLAGYAGDYTSQMVLRILAGGLIVSVIGYIYLLLERQGLIRNLMEPFVSKNPDLAKEEEDTPEYVRTLIGEGESETLEFKSSLRTNLFTKEQDRKIEQAVAKSIVAFLNSQGGTLLVGIDDKGKVLGIAHDTFPNNDKFHRHFSNVVKNNIGQEYLPYIRSAIIKMKKNVHVLKVDCKESNREVFLRVDGNEEFYVRTGPSSVKLDGSKLISYVNRRFKKRK